MNFTKILKCVGSLGIALLLLVGVSSTRALAEEEEPVVSNSDIGVSVAFQVELELDGNEPEKADSFTFIIEPEEETNPLPEITEATITGEGTINFEPITFTQVGEYVYYIRQKNDEPLENYTYDENVYIMKVIVTKDSSSAYSTKSKVLQATISGNVEGQGEKTGAIVFRNSYAGPSSDSPDTSKTKKKGKTPTSSSKSNTSSTSTTSTSKSDANTGDNTNIIILVMVILGAAVAGLFSIRMKRHGM